MKVGGGVNYNALISYFVLIAVQRADSRGRHLCMRVKRAYGCFRSQPCCDVNNFLRVEWCLAAKACSGCFSSYVSIDLHLFRCFGCHFAKCIETIPQVLPGIPLRNCGNSRRLQSKLCTLITSQRVPMRVLYCILQLDQRK